MPIKPVYDRAPLTGQSKAELYPSLFHIKDRLCEQLVELGKAHIDCPELFSGLLKLSCACGRKDVAEDVSRNILEKTAGQNNSGAYCGDFKENIQIATGVFTLMTKDGSTELAKSLLKYCSYVSESIDAVSSLDVGSLADLLLLCDRLYRITGVKAVASLEDKLLQFTLPWDSILNTFDRSTRENCDVNSRAYALSHGESLADGIRTAVVHVKRSSGSTYINSLKNGTERVLRFHGQIIGGISASPFVGGLSPYAMIDTAALGAWAEAMAIWSEQTDDTEPFRQMELVKANGLSKAVNDGKFFEKISVNCPSVIASSDDIHTLARLIRGVGEIVSHGICCGKNGVNIGLMAEGTYNIPVQQGIVGMHVRLDKCKAVISFQQSGAENCLVRIRIPEWMKNTWVKTDSGDAEIVDGSAKVKAEGSVTVSWDEQVELNSGYHQGMFVMVGPKLMAADLGNDVCKYAITGASMQENGSTVALMRTITAQDGCKPGDIPVLPKTSDLITCVPMNPYAEMENGTGMFPRARC